MEKKQEEFVVASGTQIRISSLNGMTAKEFEKTYTGILFDVKLALKQVRKHLKK